MVVKKEYRCPRCGYATTRKSNMQKHLFELKKTCHGLVCNLELTEEVKAEVMTNMVYHPPRDAAPQQIINNTINNYQQINNLISAMDPIQKIMAYNGRLNVDLLEFEDHLEERFLATARRLDNDKISNYQLTLQNIMEVVDGLTAINSVDKFNIFYDEIPNKLKIFTCGQWSSSLMDVGVQEIILKLQECYLDHYECYLIRKIRNPELPHAMRCVMRERLEEYYHFISCFDIWPFVKGRTDQEIMGQECADGDEVYSMEEEYMPVYKGVKNRVLQKEVRNVKKEVQTIIKRNSKASILDLNKKMMEMIQMDDDFKKDVISKITSACLGLR